MIALLPYSFRVPMAFSVVVLEIWMPRSVAIGLVLSGSVPSSV
jgi:hypothetical protein